MIKRLKIVSLLLIYSGICSLLYMHFNDIKDRYVQEEVISNVFSEEVIDNVVINNDNDYLGYIYIPKFNIKRLIKYGTEKNILDEEYVGMHKLSGDLLGDDLIILAGHNTVNVFKNLHKSNIGDYVFINREISRKYVIYNKLIVSENDFYYLLNNRKNELLLITCTNTKGYRLLVFLKEEK